MDKKREQQYVNLMKGASKKIAALQAELEALKQAQSEPTASPMSIAVVGMSCRFPGAEDIASFWALLRNGVDAICEVPAERWDMDAYYDADPDAPGKMYTRYGGFLSHVDQFDPQFFGMSPREVLHLDPQQRLLLEVSWEALEHAGQSPDKLYGSSTGVFVGISAIDYAVRLFSAKEKIDAYMGTGSSMSPAAGRLSYLLGLTGPSMAVDTACSSSLVATHLAVKSLRNGESDLALAGGVNVILEPGLSINFSKARMMAPDGRCKTFDAKADGYVRGEGCGILVLKRLSDAVANGDNILALIRGSAVNQDGASGGLTVPSGPSQVAVIQQALKSGRVAAEEVGYIEAHGTGTSLGDPIEVDALDIVFGKRKQPLLLGSVKTNFGHLEAAAGVAGMIKVILSLQHGQIPPHLHFNEPSPHIAWQDYSVKVPTEATEWQQGESRVAGVSSFGFSGTNAHIVLSAPPTPTRSNDLSRSGPETTQVVTTTEHSEHLLTLSAKSDEALDELSQRYIGYLASNTTAKLADICFTANTGRSHFKHRLAISASSHAEMIDKLRENQHKDSAKRASHTTPPKIAFLFTGQGSQYVGMGQRLNETSPIFRQAFEQCDEIFQRISQSSISKGQTRRRARSRRVLSLKDVLFKKGFGNRNPSPLDETHYTQPALFALEYALAQVWRSWGIKPDVVMGHSVGEYAAGCVAGVFSVEDGMKLITERGRLMQSLPKNGEMVAVLASETDVQAALKHTRSVSIAAINGPRNVVISGERRAVQQVVTTLTAQGIKTRQLTVSHAFHSPLMEPVRWPFLRVAHQVTFKRPQLAFISNVTGKFATTDVSQADYWARHIRQPVRFADGMNALLDMGVDTFVEIGPKPILLGMGRQMSPDRGTWLPSLRQERDDWAQLLDTLGQLYVRGTSVEWDGFYQQEKESRRRMILPTYPFQRARYWAEAAEAAIYHRRGLPLDARQLENRLITPSTQLHPLIGRRLYAAQTAIKDDKILFESEVSPAYPAYLEHHRIFDAILMPAAAYVEMALAAGLLASGFDSAQQLVLRDVVIQQALIVPEEDGAQGKTIQLVLTPNANEKAEQANSEPDSFQFEIFSLTIPSEEDATQNAIWTRHAVGQIVLEQASTYARQDSHYQTELEQLKATIQEEVDVEGYYQFLHQKGAYYGTLLRNIKALYREKAQVLAHVQLADGLQMAGHYLHPAILDACFQIVVAALPDLGSEHVYLPVGMDGVELYATTTTHIWCHAQLRAADSDIDTGAQVEASKADVRLFAPDGQLIALIQGLQARRVARSMLLGRPAWQDWLYEVAWQRQEQPATLEEIGRIAEGMWNEVEVYQEILDGLEALSVGYVLNALDQLGFQWQIGQRVQTTELVRQLHVAEPHWQLFERCLEMLEEEGGLMKADRGEHAPQKQHQMLLKRYPAAKAELTILQRCGERLADVWRGRADPLQLLFPEGDLSTTTEFYQNSLGPSVMNRLVQQVVLSVAREKGYVRILEIGAGTGGTTAHLLPHLSADQTEYTLTDLSPLFMIKAKQRFSAYPYLSYRLLNIEQDPVAQGFSEQQYDLILAANVLHATQDLAQTAAHARRLLAPGGRLVLLEGTHPMRWVDLTFGLTEGWWRFTDFDLRPNYPLLNAQQWQTLLRDTEFQEADVVTERFGQAIIVAQAPARAISAEKEARKWLIFADDQGVGQELALQLANRGEPPTLVYAGNAYSEVAARQVRINANQPADYERLLNETWDHVLHLWSLDASIENLDAANQRVCGTTLHLMQALIKSNLTPRLTLVTEGAQAINEQTQIITPSPATLWGMGKVIGLEHPEFSCVRVDLDPNATSEENVSYLFNELLSERAEEQVAFRDQKRYVARLVEKQIERDLSATLQLRDDRSYLITGGLGGLGLLSAKLMVERGARHLVLVARSELNEDKNEAAREQIRELEEAGAMVTVAQADVSDVEQLADVIDAIEPSLGGVIHAAGLLADGVLEQQTWEQFERVFAAKVHGAWNLHTLIEKRKDQPELDFLVLFSSVASLLGSPGQANHAAANSFMDALAFYRRAQGRAGLTINWGGWSEVGSVAGKLSQVETKGLGSIGSQQGIDILEHLLLDDAITQVGVAPIEWSQFTAQRGRESFFANFRSSHKSEYLQQNDSFRQQLDAAPTDEQVEKLETHVRGTIAKILGWSESDRAIPLDEGFFDIGMDSLTSVELRNRLQNSLQCRLPSTLLFDYPTPRALIDYLAQELLSQPSNEQSPEEVATEEDDLSFELEALSDDEIGDLMDDKLAALDKWLD